MLQKYQQDTKMDVAYQSGMILMSVAKCGKYSVVEICYHFSYIGKFLPLLTHF